MQRKRLDLLRAFLIAAQTRASLEGEDKAVAAILGEAWLAAERPHALRKTALSSEHFCGDSLLNEGTSRNSNGRHACYQRRTKGCGQRRTIASLLSTIELENLIPHTRN